MEESRMDSYRVLLEGGEGEYVEKKSRFLATLRPCGSEEEAVRFVEEMKKKYWDARHNCHAFVLGSRGELTRCSDDGEPSGTAGRPMLEVLTGAGLRDAAVVVTRYFGGVLLGTGGLARAYAQAVKEGLKGCRTGRMCRGHQVRVVTDYLWVGKVLYLLGNLGVEPVSADYGARVELRLEVPARKLDLLRVALADATNGQAELVREKELYFVDKEDPDCLLFDSR